jgi:hypothetical protein
MFQQHGSMDEVCRVLSGNNDIETKTAQLTAYKDQLAACGERDAKENDIW